MSRRTPAVWILPVIAGALFVAVWYAVWNFNDRQSWLLPTPVEILRALAAESGTLLPAAANTLAGMVGGFLAAGVVGFVLGLLLGGFRHLRYALQPWLLVLQMTPVIILAPIIVLWIGPGLKGIITVTFLISFFPIVVNMTQGLLSTDRNLVDLFEVYGANRRQELWLLRVRWALPQYLAGLRIAASLAPIGAIMGEFLVGSSSGGTGGLGFLVYSYNAQIKIPALFATGLTGCLLGFSFVAVVAMLNWVLLHKWHDSFERADR